jgi:hypothetical protein
VLTLFTEPTLSGKYKLYKWVKNIAKFILRKPILAYSGHFAVTRSLDYGLKQLNVRFNYNPKHISQVGDHVHVLGGVKALRIAVELKKKNKIKHLTAGPNVFQDAYESDKLITAKEIETYLCPSAWVIEFLATQVEESREKLRSWAAGVDSSYWAPLPVVNKEPKNCVLFLKNYHDETFITEIQKVCISAGYTVSVIIYGKYSREEYLNCLQKAHFMISVGNTEAQCLAQFEAWSVNVPIICFSRDIYQYKGKTYAASSSPYMNSDLGSFFKTPKELITILQDQKIIGLNPRQWILDNETDKISTINFLKQINYKCEY